MEQSTTKPNGRKGNAALAKPVQPDEKLAAVVGSAPLPRTQVTKRLWDYIKEHKLQDTNNKQRINADDKLRAVFDGRDQVSMFEMTKLVSGHLK
jgi:chromatin remodeling complex protein RSC6